MRKTHKEILIISGITIQKYWKYSRLIARALKNSDLVCINYKDLICWHCSCFKGKYVF